LAGDDITGVSIMKMDAGLDTGPILSQRSLVIGDDDTRESLTARLALLGAQLLRDTLADWLAARIEPRPQDEMLATLAPRLKKDQGRIIWSEPAAEISRKVRAFYPWPGAFTHWQDRPLKVLRVSVVDGGSSDLLPGTVIDGSDGPEIVTGHGLLRLQEVQAAGKRPTPANAFARGARGFVGTRLM
jgi:methionyl-tRNA formyltransferase